MFTIKSPTKTTESNEEKKRIEVRVKDWGVGWVTSRNKQETDIIL
jgi:hypothetical protein